MVEYEFCLGRATMFSLYFRYSFEYKGIRLECKAKNSKRQNFAFSFFVSSSKRS